MIRAKEMAAERVYRLPLVMACLALASWWATAPVLAKTATATVTVKITVVEPPCDINNNNLIEVNFGNDVMTTRVDGEYKKMPIVYAVQCQGGAAGAARMRIEGNGATFDSEVLKTNRTDLGIELLNVNSGKRLPINRWLNFNYPALPVLEAVPVKRVGAKLSGGVFSAGATMMVEYR